ATRKLQMVMSFEHLLWAHPSAFYFSGLDTSSPGKPTLRLTVLCDGGNDAAEVARQFNELAAAHDPSANAQVKTEGTIVSLSIGKLDEMQGSLADNAQFKQTMSAVQSNAIVAAYADIHGALGVIDSLAQAGSPEGFSTWGKIKNAIGLEKIHSWAWT